MNTPLTPRRPKQQNAPATLSIAARTSTRLKIPRVTVHHPVLFGEPSFLRDLRAAEMAAWEAGQTLAEYQQMARALARLERPRASP